MNVNEMDFLDEDTTLPSGQKYALISVVAPHSSQKANTCAVKIKGVFESKEDAQNYVKKLMKLDNSFDIFLVEMGKWLAIPPNISSIEDQEFQEKELNEIIQGHKEQQILAKSHFEQRKREEIDKALEDSMVSSSLEDTVVTNDNIKDLRFSMGKAISEEEFNKLDSSQQNIINKGKEKKID